MSEDGGDCPVDAGRYGTVVLGHGSGGRLSAELLREVFLPALGDRGPDAREDQARLALPGGGTIAMTTDAFVVHPRFFHGGDLGALAVYGTVNDLAVGGARPRWLSASFILEEGLPLDELSRLVTSMRSAAERAGVHLVTADTKVVDRGKADGVFITTTGLGLVPDGRHLSATHARPGDAVIVSGPIGQHGMAILSLRAGLALEAPIESDCAPLTPLTEALLEAVPTVRCMRDPTRGGLASAVHEIAEASNLTVHLDEPAIPVGDAVRGACEIFGLDPVYVACEGRLVAIVPNEYVHVALSALRAQPLGRGAALIGRCAPPHRARVIVRTAYGTERVLPLLAGEALPRIC